MLKKMNQRKKDMLVNLHYRPPTLNVHKYVHACIKLSNMYTVHISNFGFSHLSVIVL